MTDKNPAEPAPGPPMWKYLGWFVGVSLGLSVVYFLLASATGGALAALSLLFPLIAGMFAVNRFVSDQQRVPSKAEKWWLILASFAITLVWALLLILLLVAGGTYQAQVGNQHGVFALVQAINLAVNFLGIWVAYWFWPKRALAAQGRRDPRK